MRPTTVLLIDDDEDSVAIYSLILTHHGYRVLQAGDSEAGLRLAREESPDLVISELFLPPSKEGMVAELIRGDERTAKLPIILLDSVPSFGRDLAESLAECSRLTKPCEPSRLLMEVERMLMATSR